MKKMLEQLVPLTEHVAEASCVHPQSIKLVFYERSEVSRLWYFGA